MRPRNIALVWLAGALALAAVLVWTRGGILHDWSWQDIPAALGDDPALGAPAACEAASLLRQTGARANSPDLPEPQNALRADTLALTLARLFPGQTTRVSGLLGAAFTLDGVPYAGLVTAQAQAGPVEFAPGPGAILLFPADDPTQPFVLPVMGAGIPADTCPFDLRGWAVDSVRSVPFIALAAWLAGGVVLGLAVIVRRRTRKGRTP